MIEHRITDEAFGAALANGQADAHEEIRARSVRYVADRDAVEIVTTHHAGFLIPRGWIGALQDVPVAELDGLEVWPDGSAIELERRDIHISVNGLLAAVLPAMLPAGAVADIFARRAGKARSEVKRSSAQQTGRRNGRPRRAAAAVQE